MKPKRRDVILIVLALGIALLFWIISQYMGTGDASLVVAKINGETVMSRSLLVNGSFEIPQEDGNVNVIRIEDGAVWMESANCRDGLCIHQGKVRNRAKNIVCLPHNLVISLEVGSAVQEQDDLDVIIY